VTGRSTHEALVELRTQVARLRSEADRIREEGARELAAMAEERDRLRAERLRREAEGRPTPDDEQPTTEAQRVLRQRIDRRETTWAEVVRDEDQHWSAVEVRAEIAAAFRTGVEALEQEDAGLALDLAALRRRGGTA
jgi:hypothetical protein